MATLHFRNPKVEVNGTDLSDNFASATLDFKAEMLDETAFGDSTRIRKGGLKDWSISLKAHQDFGAGEVDATFFSLVGTTACFEVRPQNICSTAINPIFSGIGVVESYTPVGGDVGTLLDAPITVQSAGDLARNTTAT